MGLLTIVKKMWKLLKKAFYLVKYWDKLKPSRKGKLDEWILKGLKQNYAINESTWEKIIRQGYPCHINYDDFRSDLKNSLLCIYFDYDVHLYSLGEKMGIILSKDGLKVMDEVFYITSAPIILKRFNGFIGHDTFMLCVLLKAAMDH